MDKSLRGANRDPYSPESLLLRKRLGEISDWDIILAALAGAEGARQIYSVPDIPPHVLGELTKATDLRWIENRQEAIDKILKIDYAETGEGVCGYCRRKTPFFGYHKEGDKETYLCNECFYSRHDICENPYLATTTVKQEKEYWKTHWDSRATIYSENGCIEKADFLVGSQRSPLCSACLETPYWKPKRVRIKIERYVI